MTQISLKKEKRDILSVKDACHVIYTVNHVTKCPCRLWAAHNSHPCSLNVGTRKKKFDGLPDSSLNNDCVVLTYYQK